MTFTEQFLAEAAEILKQIDVAAVERLAATLAACRAGGGRLFILGVGGSAANASHAVNDFRKICGLEALAPTDNVSELSARTNDEGWAAVFEGWLRVSRLGAADALLIFSVGGGNSEKQVSPNLVAAIRNADACVIVPTVLLEDGPHLLEILLVDLQLEVELREVRPERGIAPAELRKGPLAVRLAAGLRLLDPGLGHPGLVLLRRLDQLGQRPEVGVAALDLLVDDDPVEPLLAVEQLGAEDGDVAAHRRCVEKGLLGLELGVLDPLRDLDLLLARQERHLPHLLEVHPHRVVEDVVLRRAGLLLLGLLLALLVILNLVGLQDLDLKVLEDRSEEHT